MNVRAAQQAWDTIDRKMTELEREHRKLSNKYLANKTDAGAAAVQKSDEKIGALAPKWRKARADLDHAKRQQRNSVTNVNIGGSVGVQRGW